MQQIETHFDEALERIAYSQGRKNSPLNYAVARLLFNTANKAMDDTRQNKPPKTFNVISAPTGSSKTVSAVAYAISKFLSDPNFTASFIVNEVRNAEDVYQMLIADELMSEDDVGVWTGFHDEKQHKPSEIQGKYLFTPTLTSREEVKAKRITVFTHSKWNSEVEHNKDDGVRMFNGKPRDVIFVDEKPDFVELITMTPSKIKAMRDYLMTQTKEHAAIKLLTDVDIDMEQSFSLDGKTMDNTVELLLDPKSQKVLNEMESFDFKSKYAGQYYDKLVEVCKFLRACSVGYMFLSRREPRSFIGYLCKFKVATNLVILDATSDLVDLYHMTGGKFVEGIPSVDYSKLTINHIQPPKLFKSINAIKKLPPNQRHKGMQDYADWIKKLVMEHTKEDDKVLIVSHLPLVDHGVMPYAPMKDKPNKTYFKGREVYSIYWGVGIGSNNYNQCNVIFTFNEFHQPSHVYVAQVLGAKGVKAKDSDIGKIRKTNDLSDEYKKVADGCKLRWFKQLVSRGAVRNVGQDGVCGEMTLHTTMDWKLLVNNLDRLFPNAKTPTRELQYTDKKQLNSKRERLVRFLSTSDVSEISFQDLGKIVKVKSRLLNRELKSPTVKSTFDKYKWEVVLAKEINQSGRGLYLVKR